MNFDFQRIHIRIFGFHKNGDVKSCSSFEDLSSYKTLWSHVDWCKLKVVHPLKICQHTKLCGPTLTGASFASTSED
jgi:hypothetical protein